MIDWHLERAPALLVDAWSDLAARGSGWVECARQSLMAAPVAERALVALFAAAVG